METYEYNGHENWQTRLNYSSRARGLLATVIVGVVALSLHHVDRGPQAMALPPFLRGKIWDGFGGFLFTSSFKAAHGSSTLNNMACGFSWISTYEIGQGLGLLDGTFSWGDFGAYAVGTLIFGAYDRIARDLYDSGITIPLYTSLGIQDRRTK